MYTKYQMSLFRPYQAQKPVEPQKRLKDDSGIIQVRKYKVFGEREKGSLSA